MSNHSDNHSGSGSAKASSAARAAASQDPSAAVALPISIEQLLYFNGRFLKAEDLTTEAETMRLRVALGGRAQGAGVSWGFHVNAVSNPVSPALVNQIVTSVMSKMQADPATWGNGLPNLDCLAKVLQDGGSAGPEHVGEAPLTIGAGHAADGLGRDLYLTQQATIKLSTLIKAFQRHPTICTRPGPSITPVPWTEGKPGMTGAFLLTVCLLGKDHGQVPVYGVQCGDNQQAACSLGYHAEGVGLQLVFFDALTNTASKGDKGDDSVRWRGAGARAYFKCETAAHATQLPAMLRTYPFDGGAEAPDTGTHVPIGVVYLSCGHFVAYDEWTAKRLREPAEMSYWLRSLLAASRPAQLARVLQFQSQLTDALAANKSGKESLWKLGFMDGNTLVLPGVGFLPVPLKWKSIGSDERTAIETTVETFFDGVPNLLVPATPGEMDALFCAALASRELCLTRSGESGGPQSQVFVHYPAKDYQGYVMFTWPKAEVSAGVSIPEVFISPTADVPAPAASAEVYPVMSTSPTTDVPAPTASPEVHLLITVDFKNVASDPPAVVQLKFRDGELAAHPQAYGEIPDKLSSAHWYVDKFSIEVLGDMSLGIQYSGFKQRPGQPPEEVESANGAPCDSGGVGFVAFQVKLSNPGTYSVRYMGRLTLFQERLVLKDFAWSLDTVFAENGDQCGVGGKLWETLKTPDLIPKGVSATRLQGLLVKVVPRLPSSVTPAVLPGLPT